LGVAIPDEGLDAPQDVPNLRKSPIVSSRRVFATMMLNPLVRAQDFVVIPEDKSLTKL